jgi:Protein of unknown function (DUF3574)
MIRRRSYDKRHRFGVSVWLTVLVQTALAALLAACATHAGVADRNAEFTVDGHPVVGVSQTACGGPAGSRALARTELYFGTARAGGTRMTEDQYQQFMDEQVTPRFGDGLLLLSGRSQFAGTNGKIVREPSRVLILFYPNGAEGNAAVKEVMTAFTRTFQYETVQRVDSRACVSF